jgi:hypothetical protein
MQQRSPNPPPVTPLPPPSLNAAEHLHIAPSNQSIVGEFSRAQLFPIHSLSLLILIFPRPRFLCRRSRQLSFGSSPASFGRPRLFRLAAHPFLIELLLLSANSPLALPSFFAAGFAADN